MRSSPTTSTISSLVLAGLVGLAGCDVSNPDDPENEQEVITTVTLTFSPQGGGADVVASHADPENDGDPVIDAIALDVGVTYDLAVQFLNELEDPAEDITEEVDEEADDHQVIVYGDAVTGPGSDSAGAFVTHAYSDQDSNGFPVGLESTIVVDAAGTGEFRLMLRHLPEEDGAAQKNGTIAEDFAEGGSSAIGGDVDVDIVFDLTAAAP